MVAFVVSVAFAQYGQALQLPVIAGDTITNTGTTYKVIKATAGFSDIAIQPIITNVSGTMAGTVKLYGSLDGTNYPSAAIDSMAISVSNLTRVFAKTGTPYVYYKIVITGSGTMVARWKVWYVLRKRAMVMLP